MAKFTTEVRSICEFYSGNVESNYSNIEDVIEKALPSIFDFDYPIFDPSYKKVLETKIIRHYYTREIGLETVGLWKLKLNTLLNEIMPYYNQLYKSELLSFNPLYTYNLDRKHNTNENTQTNTKGKTTGNSESTSNNEEMYSDTPQGSIQNLKDNTYLTNATITNATNNTAGTSENESNGTSKSTEEYLENVSGYAGTSGSKLITEYRKTFLNIDMMIINELEKLFMQLW